MWSSFLRTLIRTCSRSPPRRVAYIGGSDGPGCGSGVPVVGSTVDVIYIASARGGAGPGASGQVQDLQGHHQDEQEQLLDHF